MSTNDQPLELEPLEALKEIGKNHSTFSRVKKLAQNVPLMAGLIATLLFTALVQTAPYTVPALAWASFFLDALLILGSAKLTNNYIVSLDGRSREKVNFSWNDAIGAMVFTFGVIVPILIASWLVISSLFGSCNLISLVYLMCPVANFIAWEEMKKGFNRFPVLCRFLTGFGLTSQTVLCAIAAEITSRIGLSAIWFPVFILIPYAVSTVLAVKIWTTAGVSLARTATAFAITVVVASLCLCCLWPQMRDISLPARLMALSSGHPQLRRLALSLTDQQDAISVENRLNPNRCRADSLIAPSFSTCQDAYYLLTGNSPDIPNESPGDTDLNIGAPIVGLKDGEESQRSLLRWELDAKRSIANFEWAFEFTNEYKRETRLEIELPTGAVISHIEFLPAHQESGARPKEPESNSPGKTKFGSNLSVQHEYVSRIANWEGTAAVITMLTPQRAILRATTAGATKVILHIVAPFFATSSDELHGVRLPALADSTVAITTTVITKTIGSRIRNFEAKVEQTTKSKAIGNNKANAKTLAAESGDRPHAPSPGDTVYFTSKSSLAMITKEGRAQTTDVERSLFKQPEHNLVLAIDGSASNADAKSTLLEFFKNPQKKIQRVLIADPLHGIRNVSPEQALDALRKAKFHGGDNNWELLASAVSIARNNQCDVLWIHPPKPWSETGIWIAREGYAKSCPYDPGALSAGSVQIYDFQTRPGGNEILERIHASQQSPPPFTTVTRTMNGMLPDLNRVFSDWSAQFPEYFTFKIATDNRSMEAKKHPSDMAVLAYQNELSSLLKSDKHLAEQYGAKHHLISACTGAVAERGGGAPSSTDEPMPDRELAPNDFPTAITFGINTFSGPRVNPVGELSGLLNFSRYLLGVGWVILGGAIMYKGVSHSNVKSQRRARCILGTLFLITALATAPVITATIDWLDYLDAHGPLFIP